MSTLVTFFATQLHFTRSCVVFGDDVFALLRFKLIFLKSFIFSVCLEAFDPKENMRVCVYVASLMFFSREFACVVVQLIFSCCSCERRVS
ncbi:Hypothetical protein, putative [Bodo saltans]|uniref:Uncharacterized protein n=1 Tax=Bodo saltans TaxID=75058 RepID=A0A0S4IMN0_BODSA|nr:Hypothetical protein, putative [Bodo saltans]|eukprot:CUE74215.1 Hypothetical protein, putative [Bodo saltans]